MLCVFTRPSHTLHTIKYLNTKSYCEIINFFRETGLAKRILSVFPNPSLVSHFNPVGDANSSLSWFASRI